MNLRLALFSGTALLLSAPVLSQTASVEGRVVKLEKEMRAVQREVFPDGSGKFFEADIRPTEAKPVLNASTSTAVADMIARVDAIESQLATLTGQVEQQGNMQRSMETRLATLESVLKAQLVPTPAATVSQVPAPATTVTPTALKPTPKPAPVGSIAATKPSAARTAAVAKIERPVTADAFDDGYTYGYRLWEAKFFPEAQMTLDETIKKFPKHKRASYARNLLGRAWLDDKKPATAVKIFYDNYKNDARGDRAPESLFFLGSALTDLGKTAEACEAFGELEKAYPDALAMRLGERLVTGRARAKCT